MVIYTYNEEEKNKMVALNYILIGGFFDKKTKKTKWILKKISSVKGGEENKKE